MSRYNELNSQIKAMYEEPAKGRLLRKVPVVIRVDGKSFHTFTKGFHKPFDTIFRETMMETMKVMCENMQGCVFAYEQSDEITFVLTDYESEKSSAWFDYEVQKMCSVSASMVTMHFNKIFTEKVKSLYNSDEDQKYINTMISAAEKGAMFDSRCFNVPKEDVYNMILARQTDASKNSVAAVAQTYFSAEDLRNKSTSKVQDMLMMHKGINWNDFATEQKRGAACYRVETRIIAANAPDGYVIRKKWTVDREMPILKDNPDNETRRYIDSLVK